MCRIQNLFQIPQKLVLLQIVVNLYYGDFLYGLLNYSSVLPCVDKIGIENLAPYHIRTVNEHLNVLYVGKILDTLDIYVSSTIRLWINLKALNMITLNLKQINYKYWCVLWYQEVFPIVEILMYAVTIL